MEILVAIAKGAVHNTCRKGHEGDCLMLAEEHQAVRKIHLNYTTPLL